MIRAWKLRRPDQLERVIDIVENRRLYCAKIDTLNDPDEGKFVADPTESEENQVAVQERLNKIRFAKVAIRVCSLSLSNSDIKLWERYGESGQGVAVGVNVKEPAASQNVRLVTYENFSDPVKVGTKSIKETAKDILTRKSNQWENEEELRIFCQKEYYNLSSSDIEIVFGWSAKNDFKRDVIRSLSSRNCKFFELVEDNGEYVVEKLRNETVDGFSEKAAQKTSGTLLVMSTA